MLTWSHLDISPFTTACSLGSPRHLPMLHSVLTWAHLDISPCCTACSLGLTYTSHHAAQRAHLGSPRHLTMLHSVLATVSCPANSSSTVPSFSAVTSSPSLFWLSMWWRILPRASWLSGSALSSRIFRLMTSSRRSCKHSRAFRP